MPNSHIIDSLKPLEISIETLNFDPKNTRKHDDRNLQSIKASLTKFGQRLPLVVQKDGMIVRAGNGRLEAMRAMGWEKCAAVIVDEDDVDAVAFAIADNRSAELAEWDFTELGDALNMLVELDPGLDLDALGWSESEVDSLTSQFEDFEPEEDEVPDIQTKIHSVPGDVYQLGPHRLVCGDSTAESSWKKLMNGEQADVVWTDPPYGVSYVGKTADALTIENDSLDEEGLEKLLMGSLSMAYAHVRAGSAFYVASPAGALFHVFGTVLLSLGVWRHTLIWVKNSMVLSRCDYHYQHEPIFYGWKEGTHRWYGDRKKTSLLEVDRPSRSTDHPTMKPIELIIKCLSNSAKKTHTVIDPFGGSGSTMMAAAQLGMSSRLIELSPQYCDVIRRRWTKYAKENNLNPGTGALD